VLCCVSCSKTTSLCGILADANTPAKIRSSRGSAHKSTGITDLLDDKKLNPK
jgi:hypothetical protein